MSDSEVSLLGSSGGEEVRRLLGRAGFADPMALARRLARLARTPAAQAGLTGLWPHLARAVADSASPERSLANFERLAENVPDPATFYRTLTADLRALEMLATLCASSQYLTEILLRHPSLFSSLTDRTTLAQFKSPGQYEAEFRNLAAWDASGPQPLDVLRRFQHQELLRIGACDLYGLMDLASVTAQLSYLADAIVRACLELAGRQCGIAVGEFAVLGLGKLGGCELNYSSDIDLLFISAANATAYTRLGEKLIEALTQATGEGFLYRVDMRLRPWGQVGPLVTTMEGYLTYLKRHARLWEKQALLKARPIAGNLRVAETLLQAARPALFTADHESVRGDVHAMKQQTEASLRSQGRHWGEVKLGEGSIRDVEFVTQYLQLIYGAGRPEILTPNTLTALARLADAGLLSRDDQRVLADGYIFLRTVEHHLQMLDYRQTHTLPQDTAGLAYLARRLGFLGDDTAGRFLIRYDQHSAAIRDVYRRHLIPLTYSVLSCTGGPEPGKGAKMMSTLPQNAKGAAVPQDRAAPIANGEAVIVTGGRGQESGGNRAAPIANGEAVIVTGSRGQESGGNRAAPIANGEAVIGDELPAASFPPPASSFQFPAISHQPSAISYQPPASLHQHLARLSPSYAATFSEAEVSRHAELAGLLNDRHPVEVRVEPLEGGYWRITIVAYDYLGELAVICGLLFSYGLSIVDGHVYTYEPAAADGKWQMADGNLQSAIRNLQSSISYSRRKIVDVFTVHFVRGAAETGAGADMAALWRRYATDLAALLRLLAARRQREAQGELAKRVALTVAGLPGVTPVLHPIDIEIDNEASDRYTILRIGAPDTIGFLYEFSNALALNGVHIAQVAVASIGNRVHDTLYITDAQGRKIVSAEEQRELRAATVLVKHFTHLLPHSPNPEAALLHFHEYLGELFGRPSWPDELASLERPEVLQALARLLGVSDFLWEDFLRMQHENLFPIVADMAGLTVGKSKEQLAAELENTLISSPTDWRDRLNAFKDREMFRVDMRHIQGHIHDMAQFSAELSDLAEVVIAAAYRLCEKELRLQFGAPQHADGSLSPMTVCALGKCGGRELGYASDIELMFIYAGGGETTGAKVVIAAEYYDRLVREVVRAIRARREGIFEIDLQLRPYGAAGSLAVPLDSFRRYFVPGGPAWSYERQALVKLRPIAGAPALGEQVITLRDEFVYGPATFDVAALRAMRERQLRHLVTAGTINAKFSRGGLVDVEYIVQGLQIRHGRDNPALRLTNTRVAMAALAEAGIISDENYVRLREAHTFLLRLIDALRVVRGNAKDLTVPATDSEDFAFLARRLGYGDDPLRLAADLTEHLTWVQRLGGRLLG
jgi:glutamine synthetase adenylyltransferase